MLNPTPDQEDRFLSELAVVLETVGEDQRIYQVMGQLRQQQVLAVVDQQKRYLGLLLHHPDLAMSRAFVLEKLIDPPRLSGNLTWNQAHRLLQKEPRGIWPVFAQEQLLGYFDASCLARGAYRQAESLQRMLEGQESQLRNLSFQLQNAKNSQEQAEKKVRELESHLNLVRNLCPFALVLLDQEGVIQNLNQEAQRQLQPGLVKLGKDKFSQLLFPSASEKEHPFWKQRPPSFEQSIQDPSSFAFGRCIKVHWAPYPLPGQGEPWVLVYFSLEV